MSPRRVVLPEAEEEIAEALAWYEGREEGLGRALLSEIELAMDEVATAPSRWPRFRLAPRYRRRVLRRFPYVLFYEVRPGIVEFVALAHMRRKPGYWRGRPNSGG